MEVSVLSLPALTRAPLVVCRRQSQGLSTRLLEQGLGPDRHVYVVGQGARHNEAAWASRLPGALEFLCGGWR